MKTFIDCGTNLGQGLEQISLLENIDNSWNIHSFEPNPFTFEKIVKKDNVKYYNFAVGTEYKTCEFNCEIWDGHGYIGGGSSIIPLEDWNTEKIYGWDNGKRYEKYKQVSVEMIDICKFITALNVEDKSILMKLDIEGSEYDILQALEDNNLYCKIDKIYIEFHEHVMPNYTGKKSSYWVNHLSSIGVSVVVWH